MLSPRQSHRERQDFVQALYCLIGIGAELLPGFGKYFSKYGFRNGGTVAQTAFAMASAVKGRTVCTEAFIDRRNEVEVVAEVQGRSVAVQTGGEVMNLSSYTTLYCRHWCGVRVQLRIKSRIISSGSKNRDDLPRKAGNK